MTLGLLGLRWKQWKDRAECNGSVKPNVYVNCIIWEKKTATVEKRSLEKRAFSKGEVMEW